MQRTSHTAKPASPKGVTPFIRPHTCMHLCSGDAVGAFIEYAHSFEDKPALLSKSDVHTHQTAANWIASKIEDIASMCDTLDYTERPLVLPVPARTLIDDDVLESCTYAAAQTRLCHQEMSLEITDAAISAHTEEATTFMHTFRRKGFRVSVDARRSWAAELPAECWLLVDTLRLRAQDIETEPALQDVIDLASSAGVAIVAERAFWRDGEYLARMGIDYALKPRADA